MPHVPAPVIEKLGALQDGLFLNNVDRICDNKYTCYASYVTF
jgi:hypothetical protein